MQSSTTKHLTRENGLDSTADEHSGVLKQDSLSMDVRKKNKERFDNVLTNIPFSQHITDDILATFESTDFIDPIADEVCCESAYDRVKPGGRMAMVVPEGLLFNKKISRYLLRLLKNSKVHFIIRLPSGVFNRELYT